MTKTLLTLSLLSLAGCASLRAPLAADGSKYTLEVFVDRNSSLKNTDQVAQVVGFLEPDLHAVLLKTGYRTVQISNPETFQPGPNRFLLIVRVVNYDPGSKAARMLVGFGAGALVLDTQHLLYAGPEQLLLQGTGSVGSARDWNYAARKINEQIARDVSVALSAR